ncbi:DUF898 family protein [Geomonas sp. RF6]|uniref:DUF898 family protein n=1 Tax=Geomonas sp. RF6 TaxID=2897342 RepID=UPI001E3958EE|nr:DUF898 family protein [Geomonas sp. RF6]UFS68591.1 DUF898 family protein [Geomonas sp. RF6]
MPLVTVTCPSCDFSRAYAPSRIPAGTTTATCPKCGSRFPLDPPEAPVSPKEPALPIREALAVADHSPPVTPIPPVPPRRPVRRAIKFSFTGTAGNYFGIWIVNTMLKIVTFGIYSAWAKVRQRRYFYGNTSLDDVPFEYLADPFIIFKGWLVAAIFFILYSVGSRVNPSVATVCSVLFFMAMPWLIVRSRIFNMRYSAHRNIRFTFTPNYREAYVVFAGLPCLIPVTFGLITPYMIYRQKKFLVENSGYGRTRCTFHAEARDYYAVFLKALGWLIATFIGFVFLAIVLSSFLDDISLLFLSLSSSSGMKVKVIAWTVGALAASSFFYLFFTIYLRTALANLTWNATRIKNSRFSSTLEIAPMAWLYLSSAVAVVCSCGLLIPWATVRLTRYRMDHLALELNDDHDSFLGWGHQRIGSTGEEIGDMFGIEIGL